MARAYSVLFLYFWLIHRYRNKVLPCTANSANWANIGNHYSQETLVSAEKHETKEKSCYSKYWAPPHSDVRTLGYADLSHTAEDFSELSLQAEIFIHSGAVLASNLEWWKTFFL